MIPYQLKKSSLFSSENDSDYTENSFLPINTDVWAIEHYSSTENPDPYADEYAFDFFTFLLGEDVKVLNNDRLFFYGNAGREGSPVITREILKGDWGCPLDSDAHYIFMNRMPQDVNTIMIAGFLYDAAEKNQKLQDFHFIRVRLFIPTDNDPLEGKTVLQYTITPEMLGTGNYNIIVFLSLVRDKDGWKIIKHNRPFCIDPYKFIKKFGVEY